MWIEVNCYTYGKNVINTDNICRFEPVGYGDDKMTMVYFTDDNSVLVDMPYSKFRSEINSVVVGGIHNFIGDDNG